MSYRYKKPKLTLASIEKNIKECLEQIATNKAKLNKYRIELDSIVALTASEFEFAKSSHLKYNLKIEDYPKPLPLQLFGLISSEAVKYNGKYYNKEKLHHFLSKEKMFQELSKNEIYKRYIKSSHINDCIKDTIDSIQFWESRVVEHEEKALPLRKKKNRVLELKARAASNANETRIVAETVKRKLSRTQSCPYCDTPLDTDSHVDHIHPVSKGGLSIPANMVHVCSQCNSKKSNLTLAGFIRKYGLDRDAIEAKLLKLHKDF